MSHLVNVMVPEEHVMAVYRFLGALEAGETPEGDSVAGGTEEHWTRELVAKALRGGNSARFRQAMVEVAEAGDEGITTDELAEKIGYEDGGASQVSGMLGAAHRRCRNHYRIEKQLWNKKWEWHTDDQEGGTSRLTMDPQIREWVLSAD